MTLLRVTPMTIPVRQVTHNYIPVLLKDMGLNEDHCDGENGDKALEATKAYLKLVIDDWNDSLQYDCQMFMDILQDKAGSFYSGFLSALKGKVVNK